MSLACHSNCYFLGKKKHRFRKVAHTFSRLVHPFATEKEFLLHRFFLPKKQLEFNKVSRDEVIPDYTFPVCKKPRGGCLLKYQYLFEKQLSLRAPSKILAKSTGSYHAGLDLIVCLMW